MSEEKTIREEIFSNIKKLIAARVSEKKFVPGESQINYAGRVYDEAEIMSLIDASLEFWLTEGTHAQEFVRLLSEFIGVKYCVLANSGSSANLLALSALTSPHLNDRRLRPGDEVITTACGFPTTLNPILQNNLVPVFIDVQLGTYNINVDDLDNALSDKTKAIFIAHTLGNPGDLKGIADFAKKHNLWLIEDNCDALGSQFQGKPTGSFGHISTVSFYPAHHITTGEGGAVLTDDIELCKIISSFNHWGRDCWCKTGIDNSCGRRFSQQFGALPFGYDHKYVYSHIGYNLKMTDLQAAIGVAQFKKLPAFIAKRRENFEVLYTLFEKYEEYFILPCETEGAVASWFGFPLLVKENAPFKRSNIVSFLEENKISTRMLFGGNLIRQPAYEDAEFRIIGELKNTDAVMNNLFWLGVYPDLSKENLAFISEKVEEYIRQCLVK